jgi:hypothetical protein
MTNLRPLRPGGKWALVAVGYAVALLLALGVVAVHFAASDSPERGTSGGMSAFGDALLFLAVFALAAVPATVAALYLLRPQGWFWIALVVAAIVYCATAIPAVIAHYAVQLGLPGGPLSLHSSLLSLRLVLAPFSAFAFLLGALFAPGKRVRAVLAVAMAVEASAFACLAAGWLL